MTPLQKIEFKNKIVFQTLDKHARESGYKDWNDIKLKNNIERPQSFLIEELIRSALNKFDAEYKQKTKDTQKQ